MTPQSKYKAFPQIGPENFTFLENTLLTPKELQGFIKWAAENGKLRDSYDYDIMGAYKNGLKPSDNGHLSDMLENEIKVPVGNAPVANAVLEHLGLATPSLKKSNHPTGKQNGTWIPFGNSNIFLAKDSPTALSPQGLANYFASDREQPYLDSNGKIQYGGALADSRRWRVQMPTEKGLEEPLIDPIDAGLGLLYGLTRKLPAVGLAPATTGLVRTAMRSKPVRRIINGLKGASPLSADNVAEYLYDTALSGR